MFNLGMGEIVVILVLALIFLGPSRLPELASGLGKAIREIRKATSDIRNEIELDETIRKPLEELRDAATLPPDELKRQDRERLDAQREKTARGADPAAALAGVPVLDAALPPQGAQTAGAEPGTPPENPLMTESPWKPWEPAPPYPPPAVCSAAPPPPPVAASAAASPLAPGAKKTG